MIRLLSFQLGNDSSLSSSCSKCLGMKRKTKKQLARETAQHSSEVRRARKAANRQIEEVLLTVASSVRFCGQLVVQPREAAISTAVRLSLGHAEHMVLFVDGAVHRKPKDHCEVSRQSQFKLAAAVAHQVGAESNQPEWSITSFSVPLGNRHHWLEAEMSGIAGALGIALSRISEHGALLKKVIIFTDCQAALCELEKLQWCNKTKEQLRDYALGRKLVTRSQYLSQLGLTLEIHWIPRCHKELPGSIIVDTSARRAAKGTAQSQAFSEQETLQMILPPMPDQTVIERGSDNSNSDHLISLAAATDEC